MDVEVYYSGQRGGTMPYGALPAFRLFCKQNGFQLKWDSTNKRIDLDSGLKGKVCALFTGVSSVGPSYEWDVLAGVQSFLSDYGMEVILTQTNSALAKNTDVAIRFSMKEMRSLDKPRLVIFQGEEEKQHELIRCLRTELQQSGIACHSKLSKTQKQSSIIHIQLQLPVHTEENKRKRYGDKIALHLASGVLEYFQNGLHIQPLAFLQPNLLKLFFNADKDGQNEAEEQRPLEEQVTDLTEELPPLGEEFIELDQVVTIHPVEEVTETTDLPPTQLEQDMRTSAEVFFDYTLIHSDSAEKPYLLIGTLQVKNTGQAVLHNPIVCLRVSPVDSIKMGGQVLPPKLVETMAVQGTTGMKGWRYLEDDWFAQAMERGEYWIAPIQPVSIPPQSTEAFQNFQISFMKQEAGKGIVVEGVVLCNEQEVHFPSNNRIAVSF